MREIAAALRRASNDARQVATTLQAGDAERRSIGDNVATIAWSLDRYAEVADRIANLEGEPEAEYAPGYAADDITALRQMAPGEIVEVFGR